MALNNIGNTCFINTVLQCLMNINSLNNLKLENSETNEGFLTKEYYELRKLMEDKKYVISPNRFVEIIYKLTHFKKINIRPFQQNDVTEFLTFLIESFHIAFSKELTLNIQGTPKNKHDELLISCLKLFKEQSKQYSPILELFYGVQLSSLYSMNDEVLSQKPEMFFIIDLPIPDKPNLTIYDCLDEYIKDELLLNENGWFNEKINQKQDVKKNLKFCILPEILIFTFKRLNYIQSKNLKKNSFINVPFDLNLSNYCAIPLKNTIFELKSLCNHSGNAFGGHYNAYVKYDNWICYDDETSYIVPTEKVINPNIYCLIFHKKK